MNKTLSFYVGSYIAKCSTLPEDRDLVPLVIDIETDGVDPFHKDGKVVYVGMYTPNKDPVILEGGDVSLPIINSTIANLTGGRDYFIIGCNIKFDWQFLSTRGLILGWYPEKLLWDCSLVEYLMSGQSHKFPSMDGMAKGWGLPLKPPTFKELLKQGVKVSDMDRDLVVDYLKHDLLTTMAIYTYQVGSLSTYAKYMAPLVMTQLKANAAYTYLEINGMPFYRERLVNAHFTCETQLEENDKRMRDALKAWGFPIEINPTSNTTVSTILWGAPGIKYFLPVKVGEYKNGKDKFKKTEFLATPDWALKPEDFGAEAKAHGCYDVSDNILEKVEEVLKNSKDTTDVEDRIVEYIGYIRDSRKIQKVDHTYFVPLIEQMDSSIDGVVHPTINCTATHTGRTSASNPNSQNMPPVVRSMCSTVDDMVLLESDFSQLEVNAVAQLSNDPQLIIDCNAGVDIHYMTGKNVMGWTSPSDMTKSERRTVKGVNFGIIYGGGPVTISNQTGTPQHIVKQLIRSFYDRYPRVKEWQNENIQHVADLGHVTSESPIIMGQYAKVAKARSVTGRVYTFVESEIPQQYRRKGQPPLNFKPPEVKNYYVQGFATGDIVPIVVGCFTEFLIKDGNYCRLINVVHDSMLHECDDNTAAKEVRNLLDELVSKHLPRILEELFGIEPKVAFKMDHEIKTNW